MSDFVSIAAAREMDGLRLVSIAAVPSPWTEAAKGIFRVNQLAFTRARQTRDEAPGALAAWAGDAGVPVVAYEKEKLRTGWVEILLLAERLAPTPALVPVDAAQRALMLGLSHEICGEMGLGWCVRLLMIRDALGHGGADGLPSNVGAYLAPRYGFGPAAVTAAEDRIVAVLDMLDAHLAAGEYFMGSELSALDIYWATFANLLTPLSEAQMPMSAVMRKVYTATNPRLLAAMTPRLRAHQHRVYTRHLELPVRL